MQINRVERYFAGQLQPHHHHAGHPEKDNVVAGLQHGRWVILRHIRRLFWPAERTKRPQPRRKPSVQHIRVLHQRHVIAPVGAGFGVGLELGQLAILRGTVLKVRNVLNV